MKDTADIPRMTLDSADGRLDALTLVEGRAGSAVRETIRAWSPGASWASVEGSLLPSGPTWIEEERNRPLAL